MKFYHLLSVLCFYHKLVQGKLENFAFEQNNETKKVMYTGVAMLYKKYPLHCSVAAGVDNPETKLILKKFPTFR